MTMSTADANRMYFDAISDTFDNKPWFAKISEKITNSLQSQLDWVGIPLVNVDTGAHDKEVRLLDYACGPGLMSRIFAPYVTVTRGIDISPNMASAFNARARAANLPASQISAEAGDLLSKDNPNPPPFSGPEYHDFDLVAVGLAFHHFDDVVYAARVLKDRLRPGGVLVITDFMAGGDLLADENGNPDPSTLGDHFRHTHGHHADDAHNKHGTVLTPEDVMSADDTNGREDPLKHVRKELKASIVVTSFEIEHIKGFLREAGFVDVDVRVMKEKVYMDFGKEMWRTICFAKGRKPEEEVVTGKSEL